MKAKEQDLFGIWEVKIKLLDTLIDYCKKKGGKINTKELIALKENLLDYHNKQKLVEELE